MRRILNLISLGVPALLEVVGAACARRPVDKVFKRTVSPIEMVRHKMILNQLRDQINLAYGFRSGMPRVNLGPCGPFAKAFHEQWNASFSEKAHIAFIISADGKRCNHVVVGLPGGSYYDGGKGVISGKGLLFRRPKGTYIDEMLEFDLKLLDKWSCGLSRTYPMCPNYSSERTAELIATYLAIFRQRPNQLLRPTGGDKSDDSGGVESGGGR